MPTPGRGRAWAVAAATLGMLLPFLAKPFHVDDPLFLWSAEQIVRAPLDFFGVPVNWDGSEVPLSAITKNPPLVPYVIAALSRFVGFRETALHAAFALPALATVLGTFRLAALLGAPPLGAAVILLAAPIFLASATSVMCDVPMLACFVWSLVLWVRGLAEQRSGALFAAGALAAVAGLSKYFGVALLPLLALHALARERRLGRWCLALVLPLLVFAGYEAWTRALYGVGLLSDAGSFAAARREGMLRFPVHLSMIGLAFTGAAATPLLLLSPWLVPRARWLGLPLVAALGLAAWLPSLGPLAIFAARDGVTPSPWLVAQVALHAVVGIGVLALALGELARRTPEGLLLAAWILGTFVFAVFLNWTVNARSLLPLLPAVAIALARRLGERGVGAARWAALGPAFALALAVAWADLAMAVRARDAAAGFAARYAGRGDRVKFQGHWGFQYYMQRAGFRAFDMRRPALAVGDLVVLPAENYGVKALPLDAARLVDQIPLPARFAVVMDVGAGAGFYSSWWGPLPYAFGGARTDDDHRVFEVTRAIP